MMILPTNNRVDVYQYLNAQMKYLPDKSVKKLLKTMIYSNKAVYLAKNTNRRPKNDTDDNKRSDPSLTYHIAQLKDYLFEKDAYRIPLTLLCDLGKVTFAMKTDTRIIITLERNLNKLFQTNKKSATVPENPDPLIQIYDCPYISYQEKSLAQGADLYFTGILRSEAALRQGVLESPYHQVFEVNTGMQDFTCAFKGAQRQFHWLETLVVYDKSYQHTTIYDSFDLKLAAKLIKIIKFENTSTTCSLTGKLSYDLSRENEKCLLYKMLVARSCEECSSAPSTQNKNNPIY